MAVRKKLGFFFVLCKRSLHSCKHFCIIVMTLPELINITLTIYILELCPRLYEIPCYDYV
jgi:hypothetical protein